MYFPALSRGVSVSPRQEKEKRKHRMPSCDDASLKGERWDEYHQIKPGDKKIHPQGLVVLLLTCCVSLSYHVRTYSCVVPAREPRQNGRHAGKTTRACQILFFPHLGPHLKPGSAPGKGGKVKVLFRWGRIDRRGGSNSSRGGGVGFFFPFCPGWHITAEEDDGDEAGHLLDRGWSSYARPGLTDPGTDPDWVADPSKLSEP